MASGRGHVADLPFLAFAQHHPQPGGGDGRLVANGDAARGQIGFGRQQFDVSRGQQLAFDGDPLAQRGHGRGRRHVLHLDEVGFGQLVAGVGQPVGQVAIVGEHQQPFAVPIQSAGREDARGRHDVSHGGPARGIGDVAQNAVRLEKQQVAVSHYGCLGIGSACGHVGSIQFLA